MCKNLDEEILSADFSMAFDTIHNRMKVQILQALVCHRQMSLHAHDNDGIEISCKWHPQRHWKLYLNTVQNQEMQDQGETDLF